MRELLRSATRFHPDTKGLKGTVAALPQMWQALRSTPAPKAPDEAIISKTQKPVHALALTLFGPDAQTRASP